jgi:hypothetical protein
LDVHGSRSEHIRESGTPRGGQDTESTCTIFYRRETIAMQSTAFHTKHERRTPVNKPTNQNSPFSEVSLHVGSHMSQSTTSSSNLRCIQQADTSSWPRTCTSYPSPYTIHNTYQPNIFFASSLQIWIWIHLPHDYTRHNPWYPHRVLCILAYQHHKSISQFSISRAVQSWMQERKLYPGYHGIIYKLGPVSRCSESGSWSDWRGCSYGGVATSGSSFGAVAVGVSGQCSGGVRLGLASGLG